MLSSVWIILFYFKAFAQGGGGGEKFNVITVEYIKEVRSHDHTPSLKEDPVANTEEKRLELCRSGLKQFQSFTARLSGKDGLLKGTETGKLKVYVFEDISTSAIKNLPAYKCPTSELEIYIHVDSNKEKNNEPIFQVIQKKNIPRPVFKRVFYQMIRVEDIVPVDPIDMISMPTGRWGIDLKIPDFDTDELSHEQRLQMCLKGVQTSPRLNIELSKDSKINKNKFYQVKTLDRPPWRREHEVMEMFECPTQPKIYISAQRRSTVSLDSVLLRVLIKITEGERPTTGTEKLKAISGHEIAEALYHQTRTEHTNTKRDQFIDSRLQFEICKQIFKKATKLTPLYLLNMANYNELKKNHPNLWARFYITGDSEIISGVDIDIVSGPESTDVIVSDARENKPEDLFVCLAQENGKMEEYFFSKEYNMNNTKDSSHDYIAGRFIFQRSSNNNSVVLKYIIEECSNVLETPNVELLYLERRKKQDSAEANFNNPLCKLENFKKLRVCKLLFNILPTPLHELGCAWNPVTFLTNDGKQKADDNQYHEWMMPCYESSKHYGPHKVFYISEAYDKSNSSSSNDVFVYSRKPYSAQIVLEEAYTDPRIGRLLKKN